MCNNKLLTCLAIDALPLLAQTIGTVRVIYQGTQKIRQAWNERSKLTWQKTACLIVELFTIGMGAWGLISTCQNTLRLAQGIRVYQALDAEQKAFVLKYRALDKLAQPKIKRAVVIDGMSNRWGGELDDMSDPVTEAIYQNYQTRVYRVNSPQQLQQVIQAASAELGGPLDALVLKGHANPRVQRLGRHYMLGEQVENDLKHVEPYLKPK